jgi:hypothetical protein
VELVMGNSPVNDPKRPNREDLELTLANSGISGDIKDNGIDLSPDQFDVKRRRSIEALHAEGYSDVDLEDYMQREAVTVAGRIACEICLGAGTEEAEVLYGKETLGPETSGTAGMARLVWAGVKDTADPFSDPEIAIIAQVTDGDGLYVYPASKDGPPAPQIGETPILVELKYYQGEVETRVIYSKEAVDAISEAVARDEAELPLDFIAEIRDHAGVAYLARHQRAPEESLLKDLEVRIMQHEKGTYFHASIADVECTFSLRADNKGTITAEEAVAPKATPLAERELIV